MVVDEEDQDLLSKYSWSLNSKGYPQASSRADLFRYQDKKVQLHILVAERMGIISKGLVIDHINGDKLNATRKNLRAITQGRNVANTGKIRGISYETRSARWKAILTTDGKSHYLGRFDRKEDALKAYYNKFVEVYKEKPRGFEDFIN